MGKKTTIVLISILSAFIIMSSGYGLWQEELIIEGNIKVIPDPKVLEAMESELDELILQEELRLAEELKVAEEQELLEVQKLLEEQRQLELSLNPVVVEEIAQPIETSILDNAAEVEEEIDQPNETIIEEVQEVQVEQEEQEEVINNGDSSNNDGQSESNTSTDEEDKSNTELEVIESNN